MLAYAILVMLVCPMTNQVITSKFTPHVYPTRAVCMVELAKLPPVPYTARFCVSQEGAYA